MSTVVNLSQNTEFVEEVLYRDGKIIVHIGKEGFTATRFFVFTKETAKEVVDVLNKFIEEENTCPSGSGGVNGS